MLSLRPHNDLPRGIGSLGVRAIRRLRQEIRRARTRFRTYRECTHSTEFSGQSLVRYLDGVRPPIDCHTSVDRVLSLAKLYQNHVFNCLGSGWVQITHGRRWSRPHSDHLHSGIPINPDPSGKWLADRVSPKNLPVCQEAWQCISKNYVPIDWQVDFKSGYRWRETDWQGDCSLRYFPGRDVKVPWELGRCNHHITLAQAYGLVHDDDYAREFRDQVLDFISQNPPGFGIQWRCPMDVAIRVANWLVGYDLLCSFGFSFDAPFQSLFINSVHAHAQHVVRNLEWTPHLRGNHYLANVVGLFFAAAYLPRHPETDAWLAFSIDQLIKESSRQFLDDGGSFESSTSYHRLTAEFILYATAWAFALPPDKLSALQEYDHTKIQQGPDLGPSPLSTYPHVLRDTQTPISPAHMQQLQSAIQFTKAVSKPNGQIHQIGDNDSGRLFKFDTPLVKLSIIDAQARFPNLGDTTNWNHDDIYWHEDTLHHQPLVDAWHELTQPRDSSSPATKWGSAVIQGLLENRVIDQRSLRTPNTPPISVPPDSRERTQTLLHNDETLQPYTGHIRFHQDILAESLRFYAFPQFGLYIWNNARFYLAVRCGQLSHGNRGGHAHCDQLAVELQVDGCDLLADPGTYVYTPSRDSRNRYRSVMAHHAPHTIPPREPNRITNELFVLPDSSRAECLYVDREAFVGCHHGFGSRVYREIEIERTYIKITDWAAKSLRLETPPSFHIESPPIGLLPYSPGYGIIDSQHPTSNVTALNSNRPPSSISLDPVAAID